MVRGDSWGDLRRGRGRILQNEKCKMQKLKWETDGSGGMWVGGGVARLRPPAPARYCAPAVMLVRAIWIGAQSFIEGVSKVVVCHFLPTSAIRLPPSAKTCHGLPRTVRFLHSFAATSGRILEESLAPGRGASFERRASCGVDRPLPGSPANGFDGRENQARTHPRPATACHIADERANRGRLRIIGGVLTWECASFVDCADGCRFRGLHALDGFVNACCRFGKSRSGGRSTAASPTIVRRPQPQDSDLLCTATGQGTY